MRSPHTSASHGHCGPSQPALSPKAALRQRMASAFLTVGMLGLLFAPGRAGLGQAESGSSQKPETPEVVSHEAQPSFRIKAERNLVVVRAVVRDAKGRTVGNLHKEDFRLFDNGKPQEISGFEVVTAGRKAPPGQPLAPQPTKPEEAAAAPTPPAATVAQRFVGLFFDDLHMSVEEAGRTRQAALRYLSSAVRPQDRVAVFTSSGRAQLDFTDDRTKLDAALLRVVSHSDAVPSVSVCPEITPYQAYLIRQDLTRNELPKGTPLDDAAGIAVREAILCDNCRPYDFAISLQLAGTCNEDTQLRRVQAEAGGVWSMADRQSQIALEVIDGAVRRLATLPGQRSLVLVSPGFLTLTRSRDVDAIIDRALSQEVVISAIDAADLYVYEPRQMYQQFGSSLEVDKEKLKHTSLTISRDVLAGLADGTGGVFFHNSNDYDEGFRETAAGPEVYYVLTFSPRDLILDGKYHPLKVTLNIHGPLSVMARRGYFAPQKDQQAKLPGNDLVKQVALSQDELHGLPLQVSTQFFRINNSTARLSVLTQVDLRLVPFRKQGDRNLDSLRFVTVVFDRDGKYVDSRDKTLEFHLRDATLAKLDASGITSRASFDLKPGTYLVRQVVRDSAGGEISALNRTVEIPY